jgi:uncharacterized protein (TIGR03435 family)
MTFITRFLASLACLIAANGLAAQTTFEVASVKPSGTGYRGITRENGNFRAMGATLKMLIGTAYGVPDFAIEGGPGWVGSERWDVDARTGNGASLSGPNIEQPLRILLEQRFKVRAIKESKEGSVFLLDVAKSGVKMKPTPESGGRPMIGAGNGMIGSNNVTTALLASTLTRFLGRPVIDRTGLTAGYEVHITWTPEVGEGDPLLAGAQPPPEARIERRSIFSALEEDLGLKLTPAKQQIPTVTIVSAERPDAN